jgi:hypothetical protein
LNGALLTVGRQNLAAVSCSRSKSALEVQVDP